MLNRIESAAFLKSNYHCIHTGVTYNTTCGWSRANVNAQCSLFTYTKLVTVFIQTNKRNKSWLPCLHLMDETPLSCGITIQLCMLCLHVRLVVWLPHGTDGFSPGTTTSFHTHTTRTLARCQREWFIYKVVTKCVILGVQQLLRIHLILNIEPMKPF